MIRTESLKGVEQNRQFIAGMRLAFPDLHYTVEDEIAEETKWLCAIALKGHTKASFKVPPLTGKRVSYTGILIYRFNDGRIAEQWTEADLLSFLQQLGVVPKPG